MNTAKQIQTLLQEILSLSELHILSESPVLIPFLKDITEHPHIHTLPCSDDILCQTGVGMAISGAKVLICLNSAQGLESIAAALNEETYGSEFPLAITFLVPSTQILSLKTQNHYLYCQTGSQLLAQFRLHIDMQKISILCYNPSALFDQAQEIEPTTSIVHKEGTHISLFASGLHIEAATEFAKSHHDIEVVELISLHPLCNDNITKSVQKTGRALLLDVPTEALNGIIASCFWHLESQPESTQNSDQSNLSRLRARLLEA